MTSPLVRAVRWTLIAAGVIGYPVLAHYSAVAEFPSLGVAVSLAPALAALLWLAWRAAGWQGTMLLCATLCALLWGLWDTLEHSFGWVYFVQHVGTYGALAGLFGLTLARGRQPLCTRFAEAVRGNLAPEVVLYTRGVTWAWTVFFLVMGLASTALFVHASLETWSFFANLLSLPLVLLMFVAEHLVRLRMLPKLEQHSILASVLAFRNTPKACPETASRAR
jgi:uncharacterized membrane protein